MFPRLALNLFEPLVNRLLSIYQAAPRAWPRRWTRFHTTPRIYFYP